MTGAAHRIGRAIARDLAAHGYSIAIHYNQSEAPAVALAEALREEHGVATATVGGDLADPDAVSALVPGAVARLGPLGVLVNNASIFEDDRAHDFASAGFRRHMAINAEAPARLAQAFAAAAQSAGVSGLVVNIIDQRVWKPTPRFISYSASKATLWSLTRTLAQALAPDVRVAAIGPGPILKAASQPEDAFTQQVGATLLKAAPDLADFGRAVRFFHETGSITGQMLALDAGQHLAWETPDALVEE